MSRGPGIEHYLQCALDDAALIAAQKRDPLGLPNGCSGKT
jgi:hypothetical protein